MAPEQLQGGLVDARSDSYSLGITLDELPYGHVPFAGDTVSHMIDLHVTAALPLDAETRPVASWVRDPLPCWAQRTRADRPTSANAVIAAINSGGSAYPLATSETTEGYIGARAASSAATASGTVSDPRAGEARRQPSGRAVLFVAGPSGVGKSRLMAEAKREVQLGGIYIFGCRCLLGGPIRTRRNRRDHEPCIASRKAVQAEDLILRHAMALRLLNPALVVTATRCNRRGFQPRAARHVRGHGRAS